MAECCEFTGAAVVGDTAGVIRVESGSPNPVSGITFYAEGCSDGTDNCSYQSAYSDQYCDVTQGGAYPDASVSDFSFTINNMPPNSILTIDSAEHSVSLTDMTGNTNEGMFEVLDWDGLFEWIEAARNGCQRICYDDAGAESNANTLISVTFFDREM